MASFIVGPGLIGYQNQVIGTLLSILLTNSRGSPALEAPGDLRSKQIDEGCPAGTVEARLTWWRIRRKTTSEYSRRSVPPRRRFVHPPSPGSSHPLVGSNNVSCVSKQNSCFHEPLCSFVECLYAYNISVSPSLIAF